MEFGTTVFYVQKLCSFLRSYTLTVHIILLVTTQGVTRLLMQKKNSFAHIAQSFYALSQREISDFRPIK